MDGSVVVERLSMRARNPLSPPLPRRARTVMARPRLASELRAITRDLLAPCEPDDLPPGLAAWVAKTTETVADAACDVALQALFEALEITLAEAPVDLVDGLATAVARYDVGIV
ncbi:MAG TPA: hypothetical protein VFW92_07850 [Candidatus Limnocylindrales bacterium]|nr:hypothetical protein [Candidatus Limnocylindrales bacterium]